MESDPTPRGRLQTLWANLVADPSFRATFVFAILVPALCAVGVVAWIVVTLARG